MRWPKRGRPCGQLTHVDIHGVFLPHQAPQHGWPRSGRSPPPDRPDARPSTLRGRAEHPPQKKQRKGDSVPPPRPLPPREIRPPCRRTAGKPRVRRGTSPVALATTNDQRGQQRIRSFPESSPYERGHQAPTTPGSRRPEYRGRTAGRLLPARRGPGTPGWKRRSGNSSRRRSRGPRNPEAARRTCPGLRALFANSVEGPPRTPHRLRPSSQRAAPEPQLRTTPETPKWAASKRCRPLGCCARGGS